MEQANVVIVGGGVVGCAIARALSARWEDVFVLEAMPKIGMGASTRNSGVIHAGLYYPPGSLKARHCVRGNTLTYEFCASHGVPHRNTGKLVVAASAAEVPKLVALMENARKNGVEGLSLVDRAGIRAREPHVEATFGDLGAFNGNCFRRRFGEGVRAGGYGAGRAHRDPRESGKARAGGRSRARDQCGGGNRSALPGKRGGAFCG